MNEPVLDFIEIADPDEVHAMVKGPGGKNTLPQTDIPGVVVTAMVLSYEENQIGIRKPARE